MCIIPFASWRRYMCVLTNFISFDEEMLRRIDDAAAIKRQRGRWIFLSFECGSVCVSVYIYVAFRDWIEGMAAMHSITSHHIDLRKKKRGKNRRNKQKPKKFKPPSTFYTYRHTTIITTANTLNFWLGEYQFEDPHACFFLVCVCGTHIHAYSPNDTVRKRTWSIDFVFQKNEKKESFLPSPTSNIFRFWLLGTTRVPISCIPLSLYMCETAIVRFSLKGAFLCFLWMAPRIKSRI